MKRTCKLLLILAFSALGGFYAWARIRSELPGPAEPGVVIAEGPGRHLVTVPMAEASREMLETVAPGFAVTSTDGGTHRLGELLRSGPVVLTFIKKGCPCSEAAQPYFNQLAAAYPGAAIRGVIDLEAEQARSWAKRFRAPYPLLIDPRKDLVRDFAAENSAYVVLIGQDGRIADHWPGYSEPMLRELGGTLARLTGTVEKPLELSDAPTELYTGCPYEL